jgi:hypothetical protein
VESTYALAYSLTAWQLIKLLESFILLSRAHFWLPSLLWHQHRAIQDVTWTQYRSSISPKWAMWIQQPEVPGLNLCRHKLSCRGVWWCCTYGSLVHMYTYDALNDRTYQIFTAVKICIVVVRVKTLCSLVVGYQSSGGTRYSHFVTCRRLFLYNLLVMPVNSLP